MTRAHRFVDATPVTTVCARGCAWKGDHLADCPVNNCWGCMPKRAESGSLLCRDCHRRFARWIREMPGMALDLWLGVSPTGSRGDGAASTDIGSPDFSRQRAAVEHVGQIAHDLVWLVREVADARALARPRLDYGTTLIRVYPAGEDARPSAANPVSPLYSVRVAADWLGTHVPWMVGQSAGGEWLGMLAAARGRAWHLMDRQPRVRFQLRRPYRCPECAASVWVVLPREGDPEPGLVFCEGSERHAWRTEQWLRLGQRLRKQLAREAA